MNQEQLLELLREADVSRSKNRLIMEYQDIWTPGGQSGPYDYQLDFHDAGARHRFRMACWGNQIGKTRSAAAEVAIHMTGRYPDWWNGRVFTKPNDWLCAGISNSELRTKIQPELLGKVQGKICDGTGWIPWSDIVRTTPMPGVPDVIDTVSVEHVSGGLSKANFKSFEQGGEKFQSSTMSGGAWCDEEPRDKTVFSEIKRGLMVERGIFMFTRTPLFGMTDMVRQFHRGGPGMWMSKKGWDHCPHFTEQMVEEESMLCPPHELPTRRRGEPASGSGAVYPMREDDIMCDPFEIPRHWRRICGIDFGMDHPTAIVWLAHDPDSDVVYLYDSYALAGETPAYHCMALRSRGDWIPVSWPHDGINKEKATGKTLCDSYLEHRANMLGISARFEDEKGGSQSREAGSMMLLERFRTGRFRAFRGNTDWWNEIMTIHRDNGRIVDEHDDMESATRYALMMLRHAVSYSDGNTVEVHEYSDNDYDPLERY